MKNAHSFIREAEALMPRQDPNEELAHNAEGGGGMADAPEGHGGVVAHILLHHLLAPGMPPQVLCHVVHLDKKLMSKNYIKIL